MPIRTHGESETRLYGIWNGMVGRCRRPSNEGYPNHGARGIKVCRAWKKFETFRDWARENGYADNLTLNRKYNDKNYSPSNCLWVTVTQQLLHKRWPKNASGYLGVRPSGHRWVASTSRANSPIHLGTFDDPFSAAWVRDEFVTRLYEHATTNNLIDRRKKKTLVMLERRGTFKRRPL
jgi:hypothetical protein